MIDFASALLSPPQPVCIGVRLRPFSLGHKLLLQDMDSAFVTGRFPGHEDLIAAACVCAHTWEENLRLRESRLRRWLLLKTWGLLAGKFDIIAATATLLYYVRSSDYFPETEPPPRNSCRELSSPYEARLYLLLRGLGFSESEAMNMPLAAANLLYASEGETEGKIQLVHERTHAVIRAAKEMTDDPPVEPNGKGFPA